MNKQRKTVRKLIALAAVLALLLPVLTGCLDEDFYDQLNDLLEYELSDYLGDPGNSDGYGETDETGFVKPSGKTPVPAAVFEESYTYYYDQLSAREKELYDGLVRSVEDGSGYAGFSGYDTQNAGDMNAVSRAATAFLYDRCELFTVDDVYYYTDGGTL